MARLPSVGGEATVTRRPQAVAAGRTRGIALRAVDKMRLAIRHTERLAEAGIEPSVGSVGDCCDNALAETIIGLFKAEMIHRRGPCRSYGAVEFATLEWVHWFNPRRLLELVGPHGVVQG